MWNEYMKRRNSIRISFIASIVAAILISALFILTYTGDIFRNGTSSEVYGFKGLKERAGYVSQRVNGALTVNTLNKVVSIYKKYPPKEAFQISNEEYPELGYLIAEAYSGIDEADESLIKDIRSLSSFYAQCKLNRTNIIEKSQKYYLSDGEIEYAEEKKVKEPYVYEFTDHWSVYKNAYFLIGIFILIEAIVFSCAVFSEDKKCGLNSIYCTVSENMLKRITQSKLCLLTCLLSAEYFASICVASIMILAPFGKLGWNASIQVFDDYFSSFLNWTMKDFYWFTFWGGWVVICGFVQFISLINAYLQSSYISGVVCFFGVLFPTVFVRLFPQNWIAEHLFSMLAVMNFDADHFVKSFESIGIGLHRIPVFWAGILVEMILYFISFLLCPYVYKLRIHSR